MDKAIEEGDDPTEDCSSKLSVHKRLTAQVDISTKSGGVSIHTFEDQIAGVVMLGGVETDTEQLATIQRCERSARHPRISHRR